MKLVQVRLSAALNATSDHGRVKVSTHL
jgi:hypothetical protein